MGNKTPLQQKTPFALDPTPAPGTYTARAGLALVSRALRSLGLPAFADARVHFKKRRRGLTAGQHVEALVLLNAAGGDCMDDMQRLREDPGVEKMLGYEAPSPTAVRTFLEAFHDPDAVERARGQAQAQGRLSFIPDENGLAAGQMPSGKFGANAAWFRLACMAHNVLCAIRLLSPDPSLRTAKAKRLRFELFEVTGRFSRDRRKITLHLAASVTWIERLLRFFALFPLRTQPTG